MDGLTSSTLLTLNTEYVPLIGPKSFSEYEAKEFRDYVKSLYREPKNKEGKVIRDVSFRINDKGTYIITVRNRKPKWISREEINLLAKEAGIPQNKVWQRVREKNIKVSTAAEEARIKKEVTEIPF